VEDDAALECRSHRLQGRRTLFCVVWYDVFCRWKPGLDSARGLVLTIWGASAPGGITREGFKTQAALTRDRKPREQHQPIGHLPFEPEGPVLNRAT
jgi:hypothetical protein